MPCTNNIIEKARWKSEKAYNTNSEDILMIFKDIAGQGNRWGVKTNIFLTLGSDAPTDNLGYYWHLDLGTEWQ